MLAQEIKVEAENEPIVIHDNLGWEVPLQNTSNHAPEHDGSESSKSVLSRTRKMTTTTDDDEDDKDDEEEEEEEWEEEEGEWEEDEEEKEGYD